MRPGLGGKPDVQLQCVTFGSRGILFCHQNSQQIVGGLSELSEEGIYDCSKSQLVNEETLYFLNKITIHLYYQSHTDPSKSIISLSALLEIRSKVSKKHDFVNKLLTKLDTLLTILL